MQDTDWNTALYGDASGCVLRLSRTCQLTAAAVTDDLTQVNLQAQRWRGKVRGAVVEDLQPDGVWRRMAAQVQTAYSLRGDQHAAVQVPAQRRAAAAG